MLEVLGEECGEGVEVLGARTISWAWLGGWEGRVYCYEECI